MDNDFFGMVYGVRGPGVRSTEYSVFRFLSPSLSLSLSLCRCVSLTVSHVEATNNRRTHTPPFSENNCTVLYSNCTVLYRKYTHTSRQSF